MGGDPLEAAVRCAAVLIPSPWDPDQGISQADQLIEPQQGGTLQERPFRAARGEPVQHGAELSGERPGAVRDEVLPADR
ncbi:hypothetical protein ACFP47_09770 [Nesterenkonia lacusekhoensis]|uniref:Uncharacterized protein n=1 Tax=Nesterenkonia lacusekhoensis TaxID=150832 RepID=A0ABS4T2T5_9MICC|nr:hypothetical protein [Nesterenkonia lacusekhoensis]MBP2318718.1 hypothetical protein [Nesterenkonia lacusekhoensis]